MIGEGQATHASDSLDCMFPPIYRRLKIQPKVNSTFDLQYVINAHHQYNKAKSLYYFTFFQILKAMPLVETDINYIAKKLCKLQPLDNFL